MNELNERIDKLLDKAEIFRNEFGDNSIYHKRYNEIWNEIDRLTIELNKLQSVL
jgi:hypothetical protein